MKKQETTALIDTLSAVRARIAAYEGEVLLLSDFDDLPGSEVMVAIEALCASAELVKLGEGVYGVGDEEWYDEGKTRPMLRGMMWPDVFREALTRLGVDWDFNDGEKAQREGLIDQIPCGCYVKVKGSYRPYIGDGYRAVKYWNEELRQWVKGDSTTQPEKNMKKMRNDSAQSGLDYLEDLDDDEIESGLTEAARKENFAKGAPIIYPLDVDGKNYCIEHPDGKKEIITAQDLELRNGI